MINVYGSKCADFNNNGLVVLSETISAPLTEGLNGMYELELTHPLDARGKWKYLLEDNIIKADDQLFRIYRKVKTLTDVKVNARHIFYDLLGNFIESLTLTETSGASALTSVLGATQYTHNFEVTSDIAGVNTKTITRMNPVEAILGSEGLISTWGGELVMDNYSVKLLEARGLDRGVLIAYGKNIEGIEETLTTEGLCTRLMPIGNNELLLPEKYVDSPYIDNYPNPVIKTLDFSDIGVDETLLITEEMAIIQLRLAATNFLIDSKIDIPTFNYKIDLVELSKTEEYKNYVILETVELGDTVTIKHSRMNVNLKAKVIKTTKNGVTNQIEKIELGNFKSNIAKSVADAIQTVKHDLIKASNYLDLQIQELDTELSELITDVDKFSSDGWITLTEARALKLDLEQLKAESEDIVRIAGTLEIITEKEAYSNALTALDTELRSKWIDQIKYPIPVLAGDMVAISTLFKNVQNTKSLLNDAISKGRQDDGKRYVENQVAELNTALSAFQAQANIHIENGKIYQDESIALNTLFVAVETESNDVITIADGLKLLLDDLSADLTSLTTTENTFKSSMTDALSVMNDLIGTTNYPDSGYINISVSKGKSINNKLKNVETSKTALNDVMSRIKIDNLLTYADEQAFELSVAIISMQTDIKMFAENGFLDYPESISLKASFDTILAESAHVIAIAEDMAVTPELVTKYRDSLTGTTGLQVELNKWVDLSLDSYPKKMKTVDKKALLDKFALVMSTKLTLENAITLKTPEFTIDGELSIRGTGAKSGQRYLKLNKKKIEACSISGRGLMLTVLSRETLDVVFAQLYDTFLDDATRNALATNLNSWNDTVIVILTSNDSIGWNTTLLDAVVRCGGSGINTGVGEFPYAFIGVPGLFQGCALEVLHGSATTDSYADIFTKITDGVPQGIAMGSSLLAAKAQLAAENAQIAAEEAMFDLDEIADNGKITNSEKVKSLKPIWDAIVLDHQSLINQAGTYGVNAGIYTSAYIALDNYLNITVLVGNTLPILSTTSTSLVSRVEFDTKFITYYAQRGILWQLIVSAAKTYADTKASYFHIKYSNYSSGTPFTADNGEASGIYMGTYVDNVLADSDDYSKYTWVKVVGDQGLPGISGYTWIRYADDSAGTNMSDNPTGKKYVGIATNKESIDESSIPSDYAWSLIKGDDGQTTYLHIAYAEDVSGTGFNYTSGKYIGTYTDFSSSQSSNYIYYSWKIFQGTDGVPGEAGSVVKEVYTALYYPDHKSYVSTASDEYKALTMGQSSMTLFTALTTASLLHTMSAESELGWMALEVTWKVSSGGMGEIDIFGSNGLPYVYMEPYEQSLPHMTTQSTEFIKQRTVIDFFIFPGQDIYVAVKATIGTCYISRVDLVIKPW